MKKVPYDLIVIGSGPGGYSAAIRAGQYGLKTALVEKQPRLGGTCLLVGCIPTKSLLQTADVWERFVHSDAEGIHCENPRLDYPKVKERKDGIVNKHSKGVELLLKRAKVERIAGFATLKGGGKVEVKSDSGVQTLEAKNIIIATGSEARMLPGLQPDAEFILTNIEILNLTAVPKSLIMIGAGAVGVEFASIFKRFGTEVTVIEMLPRVVPVEDEDISKELERNFRKQKIRVETGARAENIQKTGDGREADADHQRRQAGDSWKPRSCWWRWAASRTPRRSAWKTRASNWTAASSRWTRTSRPPSRASTPSATWWRARRNWRTWPRAKA